MKPDMVVPLKADMQFLLSAHDIDSVRPSLPRNHSSDQPGALGDSMHYPPMRWIVCLKRRYVLSGR
jgi:hypothetical protein